MNDERETPKLLSNFQEEPSCQGHSRGQWMTTQCRAEVHQLSLSQHHPPACQASFPGEVWTLLCTPATEAAPSSVTYDSRNAFGWIKGSTTHTSIFSPLSWTQLHRHRDLQRLAAPRTRHSLAHAFAQTENCTDRHWLTWTQNMSRHASIYPAEQLAQSH